MAKISQILSPNSATPRVMSGKMYRDGVVFGSPLINITTTTALTIRNILYAELISGGSEKFNFRVVNCDYADENKLT